MDAYDAGVFIGLGALTFLTVGPSSTGVYRYLNVVSRQLEFVVHRQSEPQRGREHLSLRVFSPVADCFAGIFSKRDCWGLIPMRRSATDLTPVIELKKIGNACDRMALSNNRSSAAQEARS